MKKEGWENLTPTRRTECYGSRLKHRVTYLNSLSEWTAERVSKGTRVTDKKLLRYHIENKPIRII